LKYPSVNRIIAVYGLLSSHRRIFFEDDVKKPPEGGLTCGDEAALVGSTDNHFPHPFLSHLSFALASAAVCHCILLGVSAPPQASGLMWSIT
jgi:hypothetical protein